MPSATAAAAATKRVSARNERGRDSKTEEWLERRGVEWEHRTGVPVDEFDLKMCLKNQARIREPIIKELATDYERYLRDGAVFPSVVAYRRGDKLITIDGNHRLVVHERVGKPLTVYVCRGTPVVLQAMTYEANTRHGRATTPEERTMMAVWMLGQGITPADTASRLGLERKAVQAIAAGKAAEVRADLAGVLRSDWERLPNDTVRARIGNVLTNEGLAAFTQLALDARLNTQEVQSLVSRVNDVHSSPGQVELIDALRTYEFRDRIQGSAGGIIGPKKGVRQGRAPGTAFKSTLGMVLALPPTKSFIDAVGPAERDDTIKRCREAAARLNEVIQALLDADTPPDEPEPEPTPPAAAEVAPAVLFTA